MVESIIKIVTILSLSVLISCQMVVNPPEKQSASDLFLAQIRLPDNFKIELYADQVVNARSMCVSPAGTVFVGTRSAGKVYALQDLDGDNKADTTFTILSDGTLPNGVAFKDGDLYVADVNRLVKFENIETKLDDPGAPTLLFDGYPTIKHHGAKFIDFGPDGKLYIPVGAPCNICESKEDIFNTITRINPDGSGMEIVQKGIRNSVGLTWHPTTKQLWFTDNGRDNMGDDTPRCELNVAVTDGLHFGYPYCHQGDVQDPDFGELFDCSDFVAPFQNLGPHVAPLGLEFVQGDMFPDQYKNSILIAEHGSWNRSKKIGYRISLVNINDNNQSDGYETFADGWLDTQTDEAWGRPVDIDWLSDGSMLISDDFADAIYRISYHE